MSNIPQDLLYTEQHEWISVEGNIATLGITDYAQHALGDLTFVELPEVGSVLAMGDEAAALESCKAAASVYAPVTGTVVEVNADLEDAPGTVNTDCYGDGWIVKIEMSDPAELGALRTPEQYSQLDTDEEQLVPFIANTEEQRQEMLAAIGLTDVNDLFQGIPPELRCDEPDLPQGLTEQEVRYKLAELADHNRTGMTSFLGGGIYDHFIPAAVEAVVFRSEFYTSYTPYQPEISQGTLQAIFEFQSAICRLTEMEAANASLYDGGTALYEAMMMALRVTRRNRVIVDDSVSPIYRTIIRSYTRNLGIELVETPSLRGGPDRDRIEQELDDKTAAVIVQNPTFFGRIDDVSDLSEMAHMHGALLVASVYPISLGILKTPGAMGADIVTGEGQSLGMPVSFGGPYLGFMATRKKYVRKMPGRIVGRAHDAQGREGFVLTLQAREQHIRREKATSNICTNQGLCALTAVTYLTMLGKQGLPELAQTCADKAYYAQQRLLEVPGVRLKFPGAWYFNEFVLELPLPVEPLIRKLFQRNVAAGFPLVRYWPEMDRSLMVAVTEKRTKREIDLLAHMLETIL